MIKIILIAIMKFVLTVELTKCLIKMINVFNALKLILITHLIVFNVLNNIIMTVENVLVVHLLMRDVWIVNSILNFNVISVMI